MMSLDKNKKGKKAASANSVGKSGQDLTDSDPAVKLTSSKSYRGDASLYNTDAVVSLKHNKEAQLEKQLSDAKEENRRLSSRVKELEELSGPLESKDVTIQQIFERVINQREEIRELVEICHRQRSKMNVLKDAVESGRCAECALRNQSRSASQAAAAANDDGPLKVGIQCTSNDDSDTKKDRFILLNDGRTLSMSVKSWTELSNQYEEMSVCLDPAQSAGDSAFDSVGRAAATGAFSSVGATKEPRSAGARRMPSSREDFGFSLQQSSQLVETSDGSSNRTEILICPVCQNYSTPFHEQLSSHVNSHFKDDDTVG